MKILIVETSPIAANKMVTVHIRNAIIVCDHLKSQGHDCRLISSRQEVMDVHEQFDIIMFVAASFYFEYQIFEQLIDNQKKCKIGWLTNEFELFCNDFLKGRIDFMIANFEEWGVKKAHAHDYFLMTNLNTLQARRRNTLCEKKYGACYYGTYRKYREKYFKKYLVKDMILSTSPKNIKKFQLLGCDCYVADRFYWNDNSETMNLFRASLYIEDSKTHKLFNYMANRFFEALFCNCAVFFDKTCEGTIKKDIYYIDDYFIVNSYDELMEKSNNIDASKLSTFLETNTKTALAEKSKTLQAIESFLSEMTVV
jgi:hypothetical protein